jgi:hypothetical protein
MHWFDRVSRQVAEGSANSTRRGLLKGALTASAAAAFLPGAAGAATGAAGGRETRRDGSPGDGVIGECENCFARVQNRGREKLEACKKVAGSGRGKRKKASQAARQLACQAKAQKKWGDNETACRLIYCGGKEAEPNPPSEAVSGHQQCPEGTARCTDQMCCAIGDNCCPCATGPEGMVCCAGVIGCACC